ncbi:hypothetical protein RJZ90_002408 [Blastomyces dermatitidis]
MTPIYAKAGSALSDWIDNRQGEYDVIRSSTPAARIKPTSTSSTDCLSLKLARLLVDTHYPESTAASTIYAVSDRISLREAFDDLDRAYAAYTGTTPHPSHLERPPPSSSANAVNGAGGANEAGEAEGEEGQTRGSSSSSSSSMRFNPVEVPDEVREEIKRRIGQRIRELRNAVEQLEESVRE